MKKFLILILTIVLSFSFCACSESDDKESNGTDNNSAATASPDSSETGNESGENEKEESDKEDEKEENKGITMEDVLNHPVTPEEDIAVVDNGDGTCTFVEYIGEDNILVIPETVNGLKVTSIDYGAMDYDNMVEGLVLADSIEVVGKEAFMSSNLKYLVCGKNLKEILYCAFSYSDDLCEVIFNDGLEKIDNGCFLVCNSLIEITIPESVTMMDGFVPTGSDDFDFLKTIKGVPGSYAEEFAKEHNFEFIPIEK